MARSSAASSDHATRSSAPPRCWLRSPTAAGATRTATRSPPKRARHPSPSNPANARTRNSAGRATNDYATRSGPLRTSPASGPVGTPTATPQPAPADTTTARCCAPSAAPGAASHLAPLAKPQPIRPQSGTPEDNTTLPSPFQPNAWHALASRLRTATTLRSVVGNNRSNNNNQRQQPQPRCHANRGRSTASVRKCG
jgi:hypothetical protein